MSIDDFPEGICYNIILEYNNRLSVTTGTFGCLNNNDYLENTIKVSGWYKLDISLYIHLHTP